MKTNTVVAVLPGQSGGVRGSGWRAVRNSEESTPPSLPCLSPCTSRPHRPIPGSPTRHLCGYPAHQNAEPVGARENLKTFSSSTLLFQSVLHTLPLASFPVPPPPPPSFLSLESLGMRLHSLRVANIHQATRVPFGPCLSPESSVLVLQKWRNCKLSDCFSVGFCINEEKVELGKLEHSVEMLASYLPKLKSVTDNLLFIYLTTSVLVYACVEKIQLRM